MWFVLLVVVCGLWTTACRRSQQPSGEFRANLLYVRVHERLVGEDFSQQQLDDIRKTLAALFGTPGEPVPPTAAAELVAEVLPPAQLVKGSEIYATQCARCHGTTGDGAGPEAASLDPYPRDYRRGIFKYKSTPPGERPTHADLKQTVRLGIPDTAMPPHAELSNAELDAVVAYVKYLAMRGETERVLIEETGDLDPEGEERLDRSDENLAYLLEPVVDRWRLAASLVPHVPPRPDAYGSDASIALGRELYFGEVAGCAKCHDDAQRTADAFQRFDDWALEFHDWAKQSDGPFRQRQMDQFVELGGLPPREVAPRNLREGTYRGGGSPEQLYVRILFGIEGVAMPAAPMRVTSAGEKAVGLTSDDLWRLVDFVLALPNLPAESTSQTTAAAPGG